MTIRSEKDLFDVLNAVNFSELYWKLTKKFDGKDTFLRRITRGPSTVGMLGVGGWGKKQDIVDFCKEEKLEYEYDTRDRSFQFESKIIKGLEVTPIFAFQRYGPLLILNFKTLTGKNLGGRLANLAYDSKLQIDPSFGPKYFPTPDPRNVKELKQILEEFFEIYNIITQQLEKDLN